MALTQSKNSIELRGARNCERRLMIHDTSIAW